MTDDLYSEMKWDKKYRYKVLGYLIEADHEQLFVFDFKYYKMYRVHPKKGEPGHEEPIDRKGTFSERVLDKYGMPMERYRRETEVTEKDGYISMAALTGPDRQDDSMSELNAPEMNTPKQIALEDLAESQTGPHIPEAGLENDSDHPSKKEGGMNV